jgi:hypothetical protein
MAYFLFFRCLFIILNISRVPSDIVVYLGNPWPIFYFFRCLFIILDISRVPSDIVV